MTRRTLAIIALVAFAASPASSQEIVSGAELLKACFSERSLSSPCGRTIVSVMMELGMPEEIREPLPDGYYHSAECPVVPPRREIDKSRLEYMPTRLVLYWRNEASHPWRLGSMSSREAIIEMLDRAWPGCSTATRA